MSTQERGIIVVSQSQEFFKRIRRLFTQIPESLINGPKSEVVFDEAPDIEQARNFWADAFLIDAHVLLEEGISPQDIARQIDYVLGLVPHSAYPFFFFYPSSEEANSVQLLWQQISIHDANPSLFVLKTPPSEIRN